MSLFEEAKHYLIGVYNREAYTDKTLKKTEQNK